MSCGYALLVEAYLRMGMDMLTAVQRVEESCGLAAASPEVPAGMPSVQDNQRALAELESQLRRLK